MGYAAVARAHMQIRSNARERGLLVLIHKLGQTTVDTATVERARARQRSQAPLTAIPIMPGKT